MSKEQYDKLLKLADDIFKLPQLEPFPEYGTEPDYEAEYQCANKADSEWEGEPFAPKYLFGHYSEELAIIMESRIFNHGQLKGAPGYDRFYQINELVEFIWLLCDKMHFYSPVDESHLSLSSLQNLVEAIEYANHDIRYIFGKHESTQINKLKEKVMAYLNDRKDNPSQLIFLEKE